MVKHDMNGPADTRMMGIVHDAMRRDLDRAHAALITRPYPQGARREAIAVHLDWMMTFLHEHHTGEDEGLYPLVRNKNPGAATLLDEMDDDHRRVEPAMVNVVAAAEGWRVSDGDEARLALVAALDRLDDVLLPHLDREEKEAMPIVSASLTQREWHAWDQRTNVKSKSLPRLAEEGNWLMDGLDERRQSVLKAEVPAVPRFIVLHGFGPGYRRRAAKRWGTLPR